jgi:hypothetical protein
MRNLLLNALVFAGLSFSPWATADENQNLFRARVAPVFERRCYSCHNAAERKGDFSLQTWEDLENSGYVVAGDPEGSYLMEVLTSHDGKRPAMPKESDPLPEADIAAIRQWISEGAIWPAGYVVQEAQVTDFDWWSWRPIQRPEPPLAREEDRRWIRTPIDAFILAKLREKGLSPSSEADRRTLIRRVSYDLTGLPPSPEEVEQFLADADPLAYEKLVDRLLDSPRYGERWARHWLDVVHYGDTHGYDKDKQRPHAWPYRDYVIRALNEDKPYRRFVQEQLAGDVLWPDTPDGMIATGFIAAGPWDFIGHAEVPETKYDGRVARNLDRDDMVSNTMNAFCSLTIQCARCHNHKLDAVTLHDYYRTQAVFAALDRAERPYDADPAVAQRRAELTERKARAQQRLAAILDVLTSRKSPELVQVEQTLADVERQLSASSPDSRPRSPAYGYHSAVAASQDVVKWVQVDLGQTVPIDQVLLFGADEYGWADFGFPQRFHVDVGQDESLTQPTVLADQTQADVDRPGAVPVLIEGRGVQGRYVRVTATRLWSRRQKDAAPTNDWIFALGELAVLSGGKLIPVQAVASHDSIEAPPRWTRQALIDGVYGKHPLQEASDVGELLLALARPKAITTQREELLAQQKRLEVELLGPDLAKQRDQANLEILAADSEIASLPAPQLVYAGVVHKGSGAFRGRHGLGPREIRVLQRGDVNKPGEVVSPGAVPLVPGTPAEFELPTRADEGARRVALAQWITHHDNPLTWRSIVNRVWLYHFGRGLVDTPNDFGRGGQLPSHPELLDWLASEFRDGDQSFKSLHRLICTSATYRQSSTERRPPASMQEAPAGTTDPNALDADNRLLWRMNRRRLTAEEVRDATLTAAGKLDLTMGGPGFMDFVIEHPEHSPHYEYHLYDPDDPKTHRRAVYRFLVRSQPQPFMDTLDCADPSTSVPKREETLTSLQALTMLNNRFMVAMARRFAERLERDKPTLSEQLAYGFRLTTSREPADDELQPLVAHAQEFGLPSTCRVLLNMNEFVFVD